MLIDFHTHCFPDRLAGKAMPKLSYVAGNLLPDCDGTAGGLVESMRKCGVSHSVLLSIATTAHQQKSVNDFAAQLSGKDGIIAFGSVFPFAPDAFEELERIASMGLKGIKLHPEYQEFFVDDERLRPLYKKISSLGLITSFHAGQDYGYAPPYHAAPERLKKALSWFDSPVVAAHWGGLGFAQEVLDNLCGMENLWFDTSFGYGTGPRPLYQRIIEKHGAKKMLFGSDSPWHSPKLELNLLDSLELSADERADICYKNACGLLNIAPEEEENYDA